MDAGDFPDFVRSALPVLNAEALASGYSGASFDHGGDVDMTRETAKAIVLPTLQPAQPNLSCSPPERVQSWRRFVMAVLLWCRNLKTLPYRVAYRIVSRSMQKDPSWARVWHANIAMPIHDASRGQIDIGTANRLASVLMRHLFAVNIN